MRTRRPRTIRAARAAASAEVSGTSRLDGCVDALIPDSRVELQRTRQPNVDATASAPRSRNSIEETIRDRSPIAGSAGTSGGSTRSPNPSGSTSPSGVGTRRAPVDEDPKPVGSVGSRRPHDQMYIASMEPCRDPHLGLVQIRGLVLDAPIALKRPVVSSQRRRTGVVARLVERDAARRRLGLRSLISDVCLRRLQA